MHSSGMAQKCSAPIIQTMHTQTHILQTCGTHTLKPLNCLRVVMCKHKDKAMEPICFLNIWNAFLLKSSMASIISLIKQQQQIKRLCLYNKKKRKNLFPQNIFLAKFLCGKKKKMSATDYMMTLSQK